jgi:hypothetical protein
MGKSGNLARAGIRAAELEEELVRVAEILDGMCLETVK